MCLCCLLGSVLLTHAMRWHTVLNVLRAEALHVFSQKSRCYKIKCSNYTAAILYVVVMAHTEELKRVKHPNLNPWPD